ncbi:MAG: FAD:protein FMN transferase [Pseudomonadales bacterium]
MSRVRMLCVALIFLTGCGGPELVTIQGPTMGTTYTVKVFAAEVDEGALREDIKAELRRLNDLMSTYIEDSELSRLNQAPVGDWFEVSDETREVLALSREVYELSDGRFDVTIGHLVNLWGFGPDAADRQIPSEEAIEQARERTGFKLLTLRDNRVRKEADVYVDLSAIAKGFAADQVARLVESSGGHNYLVEIGGELRARGVNDRQRPWRIAIEVPKGIERSVYRTIELRNLGMATSGDYRNYYEIDGQRYSHTINPATGRPIAHNLVSVTVLASTAALADGLSTAINVMGPEEGLALAEAKNYAVQVIIKTDDGFEERTSTALDAYVAGPD